jgi:hypothetical protein
MFGIKGMIFAAILLAVGGTIYGGYRYIVGLQQEVQRLTTDNATLVANNVQLEQAIVTQKEAIASQRAVFESQGVILRDTLDNFEVARVQVTSLKDRLGRHELGFLAANKPGLVENIINKASDAINRCFEIASGSPLTEAEISATRPSQINRECPELANPSYNSSLD